MQADVTPADGPSRSSALSPKIVEEVRELHERTVSLGRDVSGTRGRRARKDRREAREAETDLLRVLGFANYDEFVQAVGEPADAGGSSATAEGEAPGLSLVEPVDNVVTLSDEEAVTLDARRTEAALLRVLRSERRGEPAQVAADEHPVDEIADLHARIAVFEEELAETRFELRRVRDELRGRVDAPPDAPAVGETDAAGAPVPDPRGPGPHALEALVIAAAELRALGESLRAERLELATMTANARAEAERLLEQARADAQRVRDEAAAEAGALLDHARAEAVALTRNAISTVDGLRQLAAEERGRNADES